MPNVELVRKMYEDFNERRFEELLAAFHPQTEWTSRADEPDATTYHGRQGIRRVAETWIDSFPNLRVDPHEIHELGNWVIGVTRLQGTGGGSGLEVDDRYVFAHRMEQSTIVETHEYASLGEALAALALRGEPVEQLPSKSEHRE